MKLSMPSFYQAFKFWLKLGLISFGGPAAQISVMHRELVDTKRWMDEKHFMNGLNFCMLLPGPEAQQLATYMGWRIHGARGGIAAGALFVLPSALILFALSWLYIAGDSLPWVRAIFHGLLGAVIAIVLDAVLRIGGRALRSPSLVLLAAASFVAIFFFNVSFVVIVLSAALMGWIGHLFIPRQFPSSRAHKNEKDRAVLPSIKLPPSPQATWKHIERIADMPKLSAILGAITASVVGVILNLGVKFSISALWPAGPSVDVFVLILAVLAFLALRTRKVSLIMLIAISALSGVAWSYI